MNLEGLTRGQFDRSVGEVTGDVVHLQPLLRGGNATGNADTNHEGIRRLELVRTTVFAEVAVILLVGAVELEELPFVLGHRSGSHVGKTVDDRALEVIAGDFDALVGRKFFHGCAAGVILA